MEPTVEELLEELFSLEEELDELAFWEECH